MPTRTPPGSARREQFRSPPIVPNVVVQPPTHLAHLQGDDLYEALVSDTSEKWYTARFVAEIGRSAGRFKSWVSHYYAVSNRGVDPSTINDRIMVEPDGYDQRAPWWYAGTARRWAIQEGLMDRRGVWLPRELSGGRRKGSKDTRRRRVPSSVQDVALQVLDEYEQQVASGLTAADARAAVGQARGLNDDQVWRRLVAGRRMRGDTMRSVSLQVLDDYEQRLQDGATPAAARAAIGAARGLNSRKVERRLQTARGMRAAGIVRITPQTPVPDRVRSIKAMHRMLLADRRRKDPQRTYADVATNLGCTAAEVQAVLERDGG